MKHLFARVGAIFQKLSQTPIARWLPLRWPSQTSAAAARLHAHSAELNRLLTLLALDSDTAIVITDPHARIRWVNPAYTRLTGFELLEVVGQKAGSAQHGPDTSKADVELMRSAIARGEGFNVEILNYRRDRSTYWVNIECRPIRNPAGELEYFIATQRDVTIHRLQTEQLKQSKISAERLASELAASRQQLRMAADGGELSLWEWDIKNDRFWITSRWIGAINDQWVEQCGLHDLFTLAHEDDHPRVDATIKRLLEPQPSQLNEEFRMLIAGKWRWVNFRGAVSERDDNGKPTRVSGTLLDETERKLSEERAQSDRDLLQCVISHIPHAVFWKDAERRYLGCNRKFAETLGLRSEDEVIGRTDDQLQASASVAQAIADGDDLVVTNGQQIIAKQQTLVLPDGARADILCSKVPLRTASGTVFGMLGIFNDITAQRRLERELADSRQLESVGRLAAGLAHEINTPMQYISDNVEFLSESTSQVFSLIDRVQDQIATLNREGISPRDLNLVAIDNKLAYIREQVPLAIKDCLVGSQRVIEIVTAMKVFTHPSNNGFVSSNVNDLISSTVSITRNRWKYCAALEVDLDPDLPAVRCLPSEINQVMLNLLVNAADAIVERFGVTNEILGLISIATRPTHGGILIEVSDNGCGIPDENYRRVFDPFFTTKEVGKGTGQGLTLCYGVVCNKHGGTLTFESTPGEGTTFHLFLPEIPRPVSETPGPRIPALSAIH